MTLEQLRIFIEVAEREHLTRASEALNLTPSAVSSAIRTLEERYGAMLFNRIGRRIELTGDGRIFLDEARATLARAQSAERMLSELGGGKRGILTIHASQTIASYWLPPYLAQFHATHPMIDLRLTLGNTESVTQATQEGLADIGLVEGAVRAPPSRCARLERMSLSLSQALPMNGALPLNSHGIRCSAANGYCVNMGQALVACLKMRCGLRVTILRVLTLHLNCLPMRQSVQPYFPATT